MNTANIVKQIEESIPLNRALGFKVVELAPGKCSIAVEPSDLSTNHIGSFHGIVIFGIGEFASGTALSNSMLDSVDRILIVMRDGQISYKRPARSTITATAEINNVDELKRRVLDGEKLDVTVPAVILDADGQTVAVASYVFALRSTENHVTE